MSKFKLNKALNSKKVVIFLSHEGGVQKSSSADKFVSTARDNGFTVAFFDGDPENAFSNHKKYQTISNNDEFKGCKEFDVVKNPEAIINAADIEADFIVFDLGANKLEESVSGVGDIQDFFISFDNKAQCVLAIPVSNEKCPRSFKSIYEWISQIDEDDLESKVRIVSILNTGVMKSKEELLDATLASYNQDKYINNMKSNENVYEFNEVTQETQFDPNGLIKNLLMDNNVSEVKKIVEDRSKVERILLKKYFKDADKLFTCFLDNQIID